MIPTPHPQWDALDLEAILGMGTAFVNLGSQQSLLDPRGAVTAEGIWRHGREPGGSFVNTMALAKVCREAGMRFFWLRWERFRHRSPASPMDEVQYRYWLRNFKGFRRSKPRHGSGPISPSPTTTTSTTKSTRRLHRPSAVSPRPRDFWASKTSTWPSTATWSTI